MLTKKNLNNNWEFAEHHKNNWRAAKVPGCVQMDLIAHGDLPDPYYRMNEQIFIEQEKKSWDYRTSFQLKAEELDSTSEINLVFEGLDTYADIYLNGTFLGRRENMFIPQTFAVKKHLKAGQNDLEVHFPSVTETIRALESGAIAALNAAYDRAKPYVRKAQYSFGWDWGARVVQIGIWRGVHLELVTEARLRNSFARTESVDGRNARVLMSSQVESCETENADLEVEVSVSFKGKVVQSLKEKVRTLPDGLGFRAGLDLKNVQIWFPNGYGPHPLYQATFTLYSKKKKLDQASFSFGIRTFRLIQENDAEGKSFIFEVNGVKIFCKGANWVPADNLLPRLTAEDYHAYVKLAAEANMNILRVWGGGVYEDESFYSACDEMGIMVWQDFMYSCAEYPDEQQWFQKLAEEEARTVVQSLRNHPSLVLWCGNNENNWGFHSWWNRGDPKFLGNYVYKQMLPKVCAELDPSRPYWVSSPYGGQDPNSEKEGDRHSWDVFGRWNDYESYKSDHGRFLSEFGFQAMPTWKTVLSFTEEPDRHLLSQTMLCHNKIPFGTERLLRFMSTFAGVPKDLRSAVYLSQFNQAEAIKFGVQHWRSRKFRTSGTIFWQLNDSWPVASWACLDYYKRKKALWYYSRKFFAPVLPILELSADNLVLTIVNDFNLSVKAKVSLRAYRLSGEKVWETAFNLELPANDVVKAGSFRTDDFAKGKQPETTMQLRYGLNIPGPAKKELRQSVVFVDVVTDKAVYTNYFIFDRFRNLDIPKPEIEAKKQGRKLLLRSDRPVFGLFIEPEKDVDASDNCLVLEPRKSYTLTFSGDPGSVETFELTDLVTKL